jgi:hypothetical protein
MRRVFLILIFLLFGYWAQATHIVGGGFSYQQVSGNTYRFSLTLYFDFINGNPGAKTRNPTCFIFSRSTDAFIDSFYFPTVDSSRFLPFSNPSCAIGSNVKTQILVYQTQRTLNPARYSDPNGYYVVWERCCRNNIITNIISPELTGQTFYMEFPPIARNGISYINNSPTFSEINSDYPCINQAFNLSFRATDPDGDSLVYSFTAPLKGNSDTARGFIEILVPIPGLYDEVNWKPAYSTENPLPGNPGLRVNSKTGLVTCRASQVGLYVFSVLCEEFRNGVKIGEVRREMQLLVKDCLFNSPPNIFVTDPLNGVSLKNEDTIHLVSSSRINCYKLKLTDAQQNQNVRFRVEPFSIITPQSIQKDTTVRIVMSGDSVIVRFCIPPCALAPKSNPWKILLIATDNGCSQSLSDSLVLNLVIRKGPTLPPLLQTVGNVADTIQVLQTEVFKFKIEALQTENGSMEITSSLLDSNGAAIDLITNGIALPSGTGNQMIETAFSWPEICFLPEKQPLKMISIVRSLVCDSVKFDTLVRFIRIRPKTLEVSIKSDYSGNMNISVFENKNLNFNVTGLASENRPLSLSANGSLTTIPGFSFLNAKGDGQIITPFSFNSDCASPEGFFKVVFLSSSTFCGKKYEDSIQYKLHIYKAKDSLGLVPNLLTVNGDEKNDAFNIQNILPEDNCVLNFDYVEIYNRWGKQTFYSRDRNFNWKPDKSNLGVYFLALHFKEKTVKDWIMVVE